MRRSLPVFIALLCLLWGISTPYQTKASHAQGFDLQYECLGNNVYRFTLNFYRDCAGITAPGNVSVRLQSASCAEDFQVPLSQVSGPIEVSPLCAAQIGQSTCAFPPCTAPCLPGVEQYVYQGTSTLTQLCNDWVVSFDQCCRNNAITNLQAPNSQSLFVRATLDNTNGLCNNSPQFTSLPVPFICADQLFCYNHGAVDPDGDSLAYSLVNPLDGPAPGTPIPYTDPSLSATYPLFDNRGFIQFDQQTGSMCVDPVDTLPAQVIVVAVQVEEFRNGVQIGTTTRDIQVVVLQCANQQPTLNPNDVTNIAGGVRIDSNSLEICPGVPLSFDITADDVNLGDIVTMTSNVPIAIPTANFVTSGNNPVTGTFSWTPTIADVGFHNFTVTIQDDGCPILGSQIFNFDITVVPSTEATPTSSAYCPAGSPIQLNAVGGSSFTWNAISGGPPNLSCTNCPNPTAAPNNTVTLEVVSNLSAVCKNRDTIVVNLVPDFVLDAGPDTTICQNGLASLNSSATPGGLGFQPYTYLWTPNATLSDDTIPDPFANPQSTTRYYLTATSAAGCTITDSVDVTVSGVGPIVVIPPVDTICEGETVQLTAVISRNCGITTDACTGPVTTDSIGPGSNQNRDFGPWVKDPGFMYSNRHQYLFRASELGAMGGGNFFGGGKITDFALWIPAGFVGGTLDDVEIRMGCVPDSAFITPNFYNGLPLVEPAFNWSPVAGWNNITLTNAYMWDGQSSLVIEICTSTQQSIDMGSEVGFDTYNANVTCFFNDPFNGGACAVPGGQLTTARPRARFTFCQALPPGITYSWNPPAFLSNSTIPNPTSTPTSTTTYVLSADDGSCVGSQFVTVQTAPVFSIDAGPDTTICLNELLQVNATLDPGTYSINWTPATGISDVTLEDPSILAPDTTTYVITATSAGGCTQSDSFTVNIDGIAPLVAAQTDTTICPIGGTAALTSELLLLCGPTALPCTGPVTTAAIEDPTGTGTPLYGPHFIFNGVGYSNRRQFIYHRTELDSMGFAGGGKITAIALDYTTANDPNTDITIKMGCTTLDEFPASLAFVPNLDVVMTSSSVTPNLGYTVYNLTTPFMWDGQTNLIVEFCTDVQQTGASATPQSNVRFHTSQGGTLNTCMYQNLFNANGGCSTPNGLARTFFRPNMQFTFCDATPTGLSYSWTPSATLDNATIPNPNATPSQTTTYSLTVSDGGSCSGGDQVTVAIDSTNFVSATQNVMVACPAPTYQLDALVSGPPTVPALPSCGVNGTTCSQAQNTNQVGMGTDTLVTFYSPFWQTTADYRAQYLYRASDLLAAGVQSGTITAFAVNVTSVLSSNQYDSLTFRMGCTNATELTNAQWETTSLVLGPIVYTALPGWQQFNLTAPFDWDGTSNIVIEVCNSNTTTSTADRVEYTNTAGYNGTMVQVSGTPPGCSFPSAGAFVQPGYPNIRFTVCPPPPLPFAYNWSPSTGLSNPSIQNPVFTDPTPSLPDTFTVLVTGGDCDVFDTVIIPPCILPIEFLELYGEREGDAVQLDWVTNFETNVQAFIVERSANGGAFEPLGTEPAMGTTQELHRYDFMDHRPAIGENVYRITAVDFDGATSRSNSVTIIFSDESGLIALYPNPTREDAGFLIDYYASAAGALEVELMDVWGRKISREVLQLEQGTHQFEYATQSVAQGTYIVRLKFGTKTELRKLLIVE